jgi:protein O-mannosyl-transferase
MTKQIIRYHRVLCFLLLALAVTLAYFRTFHVPFVFDDFHSIVDNPRIKDYLFFISPQAISLQRPLADLTFALNYHTGGLSLFGFHLVNTLIHIINSFLVYVIAFFVFTRLTGYKTASSGKGNADQARILIILAALGTAFFFALHPLQTQAVTYIAQRYTSLCAFFSLLCVWFFIRTRLRIERARPRPGTGWFDPVTVLLMTCALVFSLAAFLSKQNAVMLPGLIILFEVILFKDDRYNWKKIALAVIPVIFLFTLFILYSAGALKGDFSLGALLDDVRARTMETRDVSRWTYLITQISVLVLYMRMTVLPFGQNIDHMRPFSDSLFNVPTLLSLGIILVVMAAAVVLFKKRPIIALAAGWFFIALSVESSVIPIRDAMFEHRMYLPMLGPALIFGYLVYVFAERVSKKTLVLVPVGFLIIALGVTTILRNEVWRDPVKLWSDSTRKNPNNYRAWTNLGQALLAENKLVLAQKSLAKSLELRKNNPQALGNLGIALARQGKFNEALPYLKTALELMPKSFDFHYNLGVTYGVSGKYAQAVEHYQKALELRPDHLRSLMNLGVEYGRLNRLDQAAETFSKALELSPNNPDLLMNLSIVYFNQGKYKQALEKMLQAEKFSPKSSEVQTNLGIISHAMGDSKEAMKYLGRAVQLDPSNKMAREYADQIIKEMQTEALRRMQGAGEKD